MNLTEEIITAATEVGKTLSKSPEVMEYQEAVLAIQNNPEVFQLENKVNQSYEKLATQERAGQTLDQAELQNYYTIRSQLRQDPLISARDEKQQMVKLLFNDVLQTMTPILGIDFTILAL
jgi:cell fate (sporulation/competence/biofilm development) regulator YlbF (YheA/YmcA/DUF963 family)